MSWSTAVRNASLPMAYLPNSSIRVGVTLTILVPTHMALWAQSSTISTLGRGAASSPSPPLVVLPGVLHRGCPVCALARPGELVLPLPLPLPLPERLPRRVPCRWLGARTGDAGRSGGG